MIDTELSKTIKDILICNNASEVNDSEKKNKIEHHFAKILHTLGLNLYEDSLCGTPKRAAKMFEKKCSAD